MRKKALSVSESKNQCLRADITSVDTVIRDKTVVLHLVVVLVSSAIFGKKTENGSDR